MANALCKSRNSRSNMTLVSDAVADLLDYSGVRLYECVACNAVPKIVRFLSVPK